MPAFFENPALLALILVGSLAFSLGLHLWARRAVGLDDRRALQLTWLLPLLALAAKLAVLVFVGLEIAPALGTRDAAEKAWILAAGLSCLVSWGVVLWLPATVVDMVVLLVLSAVTFARRKGR